MQSIQQLKTSMQVIAGIHLSSGGGRLFLLLVSQSKLNVGETNSTIRKKTEDQQIFNTCKRKIIPKKDRGLVVLFSLTFLSSVCPQGL